MLCEFLRHVCPFESHPSQCAFLKKVMFRIPPENAVMDASSNSVVSCRFLLPCHLVILTWCKAVRALQQVCLVDTSPGLLHRAGGSRVHSAEVRPGLRS